MAKRDDELMMMGKLWRLLEPLSADARGRILMNLLLVHILFLLFPMISSYCRGKFNIGIPNGLMALGLFVRNSIRMIGVLCVRWGGGLLFGEVF